MKKVIDNKTVHFVYGTRTNDVRQNKEVVSKEQKTTTCVIRDERTSEEVTSATVVLYHKDTDQRLVGRRSAFQKAVNKLEDKEERARLWEGYKTSFKMP